MESQIKLLEKKFELKDFSAWESLKDQIENLIKENRKLVNENQRLSKQCKMLNFGKAPNDFELIEIDRTEISMDEKYYYFVFNPLCRSWSSYRSDDKNGIAYYKNADSRLKYYKVV